MQAVDLVEFETRLGVPLSPEQCDQLRRLTESISLAPATGQPGCYDLTASSFVGAVRMEGLDLTVRPKVPLDRLLFLIAYGMGNVRWLLDFEMAEAPSLPEAIVPAFVRRVEAAIRPGVLQAYRSTDESGLTVRGRWRVSDQIRRRFGVAPPVEITFDDYTVDNDLNRILLAATLRLQRIRLQSARSRTALRSLIAHLEGVTPVDFDARRLPPVHFDRLTMRYRPAIELSRLIISATSFDLSRGQVAASAFLVDMNKVFEDFVVAALRDELGLTERELVQGSEGHALHLDEATRIPLKPDLSIWSDGVPVWVGDAKYKRIVSAQAPNADVYQALAYAIATGLDSVILVYAAGEREPATHSVRNAGKLIRIASVNLSGTPDDILASVRRLADEVLVDIRHQAPFRSSAA